MSESSYYECCDNFGTHTAACNRKALSVSPPPSEPPEAIDQPADWMYHAWTCACRRIGPDRGPCDCGIAPPITEALPTALLGKIAGIDGLVRNALIVAEGECALRLVGIQELAEQALSITEQIRSSLESHRLPIAAPPEPEAAPPQLEMEAITERLFTELMHWDDEDGWECTHPNGHSILFWCFWQPAPTRDQPCEGCSNLKAHLLKALRKAALSSPLPSEPKPAPGCAECGWNDEHSPQCSHAGHAAPPSQSVHFRRGYLVERLEHAYDFQCEGGPLANCTEWRELIALPLASPVSAVPPTEIEIAERIARAAHAGQKDTVTGADYITHVERVVGLVEGNQAKAVAWLHDVLEDSETTSADLVLAGISDDVRMAVERLTRGDEPYSEYISTIRVCGPELARVVKLADLMDHLRPNCPARLRPRYEAAFKALTGSPSDVESNRTAASELLAIRERLQCLPDAKIVDVLQSLLDDRDVAWQRVNAVTKALHQAQAENRELRKSIGPTPALGRALGLMCICDWVDEAAAISFRDCGYKIPLGMAGTIAAQVWLHVCDALAGETPRACHCGCSRAAHTFYRTGGIFTGCKVCRCEAYEPLPALPPSPPTEKKNE